MSNSSIYLILLVAIGGFTQFQFFALQNALVNLAKHEFKKSLLKMSKAEVESYDAQLKIAYPKNWVEKKIVKALLEEIRVIKRERY